MSDFRIRKVKVLQGKAKAEAEKQGLNPEDLVIVKTSVKSGSLPEYHIEKIEEDPVSHLLKRVEQEIKEKSKNYAKMVVVQQIGVLICILHGKLMSGKRTIRLGRSHTRRRTRNKNIWRRGQTKRS
jgi:hypothetical protein